MDDLEDLEMNHSLTSDQKLKSWGYGEWVEEPDYVIFKYKGFNCKIIRDIDLIINDEIMGTGVFYGYVKIPKNHPWINEEYDEIDCEVHGGLTFGECNSKDDYWVGFDCAHSGDLVPGIGIKSHIEIPFTNGNEKLIKMLDDFRLDKYNKRKYRNVQFCIEECKKVVDQAIEAMKTNNT